MSLAPVTIAIRNKQFIKRTIRYAKANGERVLSKVVQQLAEDRLAELEQPAATSGVGSAGGRASERQ